MASLEALAELLPGPGEWTEADYFPLSDRGKLVELSDGNIEVLPMPTDYHQLLAARLFLAVHTYLSAHPVGKVRFAPLPVRLWAGKIREPDIMFMSTANTGRIGKYWGVPDMAIEIVSEGGERHDRQTKRGEYAQAGITEYWIVEPEAKTVEVLRLDDSSGSYTSLGVFQAPGSLTSPMFPGLSLPMAELFAPEDGLARSATPS